MNRSGGELLRHGARLVDGGAEFRLWAPRQPRMGLQLLGPVPHSVPMQRDAAGWHRARIDGVPAGAQYLFRTDDGRQLPDPASRLQADTVHGPSVLVDPTFGWNDQGHPGLGLDDLVIYELHVGTFTAAGTFDAVIEHLPRLQDLGITAVELLPVAQFPGRRNWGYDGVLPFAVQNSYGGLPGLQRLVAACHAHGLGVILDVVYNHMGPEGNYLSTWGPYFTDAYRTPWGAALNFDDNGSDEVRRFLLESALFLVEHCHLDGLRLDAVHAILDHSARPFVQQLTAEVHTLAARLGRAVLVIAESSLNDARLLRSPQHGGFGMDAQWSDDFHHALHAFGTGERARYYVDFGSIEQVARAYRQGWLFDGQHSRYRGRRHGNSPHHFDSRRFVVFTQNHDQIGNRPLGDRLGAPDDFALQRLLAAALLLSPFTPLLFMGQEYGETAPFLYFVDHGDPALREAVRRGRHEEFEGFGWEPQQIADPGDAGTFARSQLDHGLANTGAHAGLHRLYRALLRLRRQRPALHRGGTDELEATVETTVEATVEGGVEGGVVLVRRWFDDDEVLLALAFADGGAISRRDGWQLLLDTDDPHWRGEADAPRPQRRLDAPLRLAPQSAVLLHRQEPPT